MIVLIIIVNFLLNGISAFDKGKGPNSKPINFPVSKPDKSEEDRKPVLLPKSNPVVVAGNKPVVNPFYDGNSDKSAEDQKPVLLPKSNPVVVPESKPVINPFYNENLELKPKSNPVVSPTYHHEEISPISSPKMKPTSNPIQIPTSRPVNDPSAKPILPPTEKPIPVSKKPTIAPTQQETYKESVILSSNGGLLTVILTMVQGTTTFNTVKGNVKNLLVWNYELVNGTSSNGQLKGQNLYPSPSLHVNPGDTMVLYIVNKMQVLSSIMFDFIYRLLCQGLTMADYYDPAFVTFNSTIPLYPPPLTECPFNLHIHGIHISPVGNQDNVLIEIPAGKYNVYTYHFPDNQPNGLYWYHGHRHLLTEVQTSRGLAGLLIIGRADGQLPIVTQNNLVVRNMALQITNIFDRKGGQSTWSNPFLGSFASTVKLPKEGQLKAGTYKPILAPFNFLDSKEDTTYITEWFAGK